MDLSALGRSPQILELKKRLTQISGNTAPVLLSGEHGSGFEICAHFLHQPASRGLKSRIAPGCCPTP